MNVPDARAAGTAWPPMSSKPPRKPLRSSQSVPLTRDVGLPSPRRVRSTQRMLVVDPNEETRLTVAEHYRARGWLVFAAATTRQAIDLALDNQPDVIVVELFMPNVDPRHLLRTLRSSVEHDVRIVGVAQMSPTQFEHARQAGADAVVRRPLDIAAIDASVGAS